METCRIFSCSVRSLSYSMWDLVPWPGIEPGPSALGAWSIIHSLDQQGNSVFYFLKPEALKFRSHIILYWSCPTFLSLMTTCLLTIIPEGHAKGPPTPTTPADMILWGEPCSEQGTGTRNFSISPIISYWKLPKLQRSFHLLLPLFPQTNFF